MSRPVEQQGGKKRQEEDAQREDRCDHISIHRFVVAGRVDDAAGCVALSTAFDEDGSALHGWKWVITESESFNPSMAMTR